ncbi:hypothetical protein MRB53_023070 [Persea americana]|uniref:Uncharacterized protein n=1 Tax=Persea americana TaxID=3435 RepID=A0ACC2L9H7_PERAE|nr:hypothetical protein MRB53_023070 [Persea americana]
MLVKFVLVGDPEVGKSTILQNLCDPSYDPVIGIDVAYHEIVIDAVRPVPIKLKIWNTTGQASLRTVTSSYCKDAAAVLLVYDITRRETFNHLESWLEVSGWQADSKRIITLLASGLTSENIEEVFESMAKEIYEMVQEGELHAPDEVEGRESHCTFVDKGISTSNCLNTHNKAFHPTLSITCHHRCGQIFRTHAELGLHKEYMGRH